MKTLTKYDILVVVLNRLYLLLVIGLHIRYGVQIPIYLERGRKHLKGCFPFHFTIVQILIYLERGRKPRAVARAVKSPIICIDTYLPREGPETGIAYMQGHTRTCGIAPYLPREGTETHQQKPFHRKCQGIATNLPREGPETCTHKRGKPSCSCLYSYLSTSRGAGNSTWFGFSSVKISCISPYLPREGPETVFVLVRLLFLFSYISLSTLRMDGISVTKVFFIGKSPVQIPIYLARGRKPVDSKRIFVDVVFVQIPMYLARGRKPYFQI